MANPRISQAKIVYMVSQKSGLSQEKCKRVISDYANIIRQCCMSGMDVVIPNIGRLSLEYRKARPEMVSPFTKKGEPIEMLPPRAAYNYPKFYMSKAFLRDAKDLTLGNALIPSSMDESEIEEVDDEASSEDE